jgi:hypothetical protein
MKKLSELIRIISVRRLDKEEQKMLHIPPQQSPGSTRASSASHEPCSKHIEETPADAARKLWCRANHF